MLMCVGDEEQHSIAFQRFDDEEEEQHGEEEWRREEVENVGEEEKGEEAEFERVPRQTRRRHVVAAPIASAREEDRVLIRPPGDR
jgi:hypothetical protein